MTVSSCRPRCAAFSRASRSRWPSIPANAWPTGALAHGYSDEQRQSLHKLIRTIVSRDHYLRAVASGSSRIDLDGVEAGPVSDIERESAAKRLAAIAAKRMKPEAAIAAAAGTGAGAARGQATPFRRWRPLRRRDHQTGQTHRARPRG